ncbi:hypothetical protein CEXT_130501 [Caerostris extrusa]|uniref:Uncharacterized protein n=1 Tax=Caerostris extrusa TaxID=172846 RepID=A0AAV4NVK1_CAEEX|nr:hypothetical protein CEXT_130501 [Caerostris extrusa]
MNDKHLLMHYAHAMSNATLLYNTYIWCEIAFNDHFKPLVRIRGTMTRRGLVHQLSIYGHATDCATLPSALTIGYFP